MSEDSMRAAKACRFVPNVEDILSAIFGDFKFTLHGAEITASEVFSREGFLPAIGFISASRMKDTYGIDIQVPIEEEENSITGYALTMKFENPSQTLMFLLTATTVSHEIFGRVPGLVNVDKLFDWMFSPEVQEQGLPCLVDAE